VSVPVDYSTGYGIGNVAVITIECSCMTAATGKGSSRTSDTVEQGMPVCVTRDNQSYMHVVCICARVTRDNQSYMHVVCIQGLHALFPPSQPLNKQASTIRGFHQAPPSRQILYLLQTGMHPSPACTWRVIPQRLQHLHERTHIDATSSCSAPSRRKCRAMLPHLHALTTGKAPQQGARCT